MRFRLLRSYIVLAAITGVCCVTFVGGVEPANESSKGDERQTGGAEGTLGQQPVSVERARDRAKLMHTVYAATLEVMHEHYFDKNKAVLPARAMEDIFAELSRQSNIDARWISVNTKPMSVRHEPKSDFEKLAAKAIAGGKEEFEQIENGRYLRATPILLSDNCITCHTGFFSAAPKSPRFAGLVISIPVSEK
jgi:hypothetical protein